MESPFVYGKIATGKAFGSRKSDLKRISGNFKNKIPTALIAPRRWGKSSLIAKVTEEFRAFTYYRVCNLDMFHIRSEREFYQGLANEVIRSMAANTAERLELAKKFLIGVTPQLALGIDAENEFDVRFEFSGKMSESVLNLANDLAKKKSLTLLVCIDNFHNIENFKNAAELLRRLRSSWEGHSSVVYCLSGNKRSYLSKLFTDPAMPFYKFGDLVMLEKPPAEELASFIAERFAETGKTINLDLAGRIALLMDCHPLYVQMLSHIVWENTKTRADEVIISNALEELIHRNLLLFQKEFDGLSNIQVNFLKAISLGVSDGFTSKEVIKKYNLNSSASALRALEGLENKEIIERLPSGLEFADPAFRLWLKQVWA